MVYNPFRFGKEVSSDQFWLFIDHATHKTTRSNCRPVNHPPIVFTSRLMFQQPHSRLGDLEEGNR